MSAQRVEHLRRSNPTYERLYQAMLAEGEEDKFVEVVQRHERGNKMARNEWGGGLNHTTRDYAITEAEKFYADLNRRPMDWTHLTPFYKRGADALPGSLAGYHDYKTDILDESAGTSYFGRSTPWTEEELAKNLKAQGQGRLAMDIGLLIFGTTPVDLAELAVVGARLIRNVGSRGIARLSMLLKEGKISRAWLRKAAPSEIKAATEGKLPTVNERITADLNRQANNVKPTGEEWHPSARALDDIVQENDAMHEFMTSQTGHTQQTWPFKDPMSGQLSHAFGQSKFSQADFYLNSSYEKLATNMKTKMNEAVEDIANKIPLDLNKKSIENIILGKTLPQLYNTKYSLLEIGKSLVESRGRDKEIAEQLKQIRDREPKRVKTLPKEFAPIVEPEHVEEPVHDFRPKVTAIVDGREDGVTTSYDTQFSTSGNNNINSRTPDPNSNRTGVVHFLREGDRVNFLGD